MHYMEYVVNMQKTLPKQPHTLVPDAVRKHNKKKKKKKEKKKKKNATIPKLKSLYHKTSGINPEKSAIADSRNDMHAEKFYAAGVIRSKKISNAQELIQSDPISCPQNQKRK